MREYLSKISEWIVAILVTCIVTYLAVLVFLYRFNTEDSIPMLSNVFLQLFFVGASIGGTWLLGHFLNPYQKICRWISILTFVFVLAFVGAISFSFVTEALILPGSDAKSCYDIALRFYQSEFGAVVPEGSYLSLWPFQTGLIFILEKIMRIFHNTDPLLFQQINCVYLLVILSSGYGIVCTITKRIEGRVLYLLLMATYWPLIFRVTEVYGDIPGLAWIMLSYMCYIWFYKTDNKWGKLALALSSGGAAIIACVYKSNCLIYVIALLLVSAIMLLRKWHVGLAVMVIITVILSAQTTKLTQKYYEACAGNICGEGVPAIAYIAMGLQYNGEEAIPGGWNGFHANTYIETGYNRGETVTRSKESINNSLRAFGEDPMFMFHFFHNKVLKQWANQTHGIYWGAYGYYDINRNAEDFWVNYLENTQYKELTDFEDVHESIVYGILILSCAYLVKSKIRKEKICFVHLLPFVTFIGGFLFSLIWEGQTDAVMYYPIFALPMAIGFLCRQWEAKKAVEHTDFR